MRVKNNFIESFTAGISILENYIPSKIYAVKNAHLQYIYLSERFAKIYGLTSRDMLFKDDGQIAQMPSEGQVFAQDAEIMNTKASKYYLKIINSENRKKVFVLAKVPIIDPLSHECLGVLLECSNFNIFSISRNICKNLPHDMADNLKYLGNIKLSHREQQVVFLFLANFNSQEIAEVINQIEHKDLTKNTIDSIFRNLFMKFNCINRVQLYEVLIRNHFEHLLPLDILPEGSILLPDSFNNE